MSDHGKVNGDYGEQMSAEEVLALYEQRARVIAWEWETPAAPREDLAQEGRIALWRESQRHPGERMEGLASVVIRRAVSNAVRDQRWFGTEYPKGGHPVDPIRRSPSEIEHEVENGLMLVAADVLDGVEYAYHHGEIVQAINALPEAHREYVYLKFWMGMSESEIAAVLGRSKSNSYRTWTDTIRPRLREHLGHLVGAW